MSKGIDYIQTNKEKECLTLFVKTWATILPYHLVWEKELFTKELAIDFAF